MTTVMIQIQILKNKKEKRLEFPAFFLIFSNDIDEEVAYVYCHG